MWKGGEKSYFTQRKFELFLAPEPQARGSLQWKKNGTRAASPWDLKRSGGKNTHSVYSTTDKGGTCLKKPITGSDSREKGGFWKENKIDLETVISSKHWKRSGMRKSMRRRRGQTGCACREEDVGRSWRDFKSTLGKKGRPTEMR